MGEVTFKGKTYIDIDESSQKMLDALKIQTFRYFPKERVWMASDTCAKHFGIEKFYDVAADGSGPCIVSEQDAKKDIELYKKVMSGDNFASEIVLAKNLVDYYRVTLNVLEKDEDGNPVVVAGAIEDYNEYMQQVQLAYIDQVTEGYNLVYYNEMLKQETRPGYIISFDVYAFKVINNTFGMQKGDEVLRSISTLLHKYTDGRGFYGHINADHFIMYMSIKEEEIKRLLYGIKCDLEIISHELGVTPVVPYFGVTFWNTDKRKAVAFSEASVAKHKIISGGDVDYAIYNADDERAAVEEKEIADNFSNALKTRQFEVWYQPKYTPLTKELTGAEALVRWRKPDGSLFSPGKFIPVFEKNGMIRQLDEYVFRTVCEQQKIWIEELGQVVPVSVNLSRASMYYDGLVERYAEIAMQSGTPPQLVPIEITESATIDNAKIKVLAEAFYNAGFPLYIDDFGSGYSSLSTLNMMRFDTLKLDKSLIDYIGEFGGDRLIRHTIALAKDLGLHVTAEGVENEIQAEFLRDVECDNIQGFVYARPMPTDNFVECLKADQMSDRFAFRRGQLYTYPIIVDMVKMLCSDAAAEGLHANKVAQINIYGDCEGAFYVEFRHGRVNVQPYEYYDRDLLVTIPVITLVDILKGKLRFEDAHKSGCLNIEGDESVLSLLQRMIRR